MPNNQKQEPPGGCPAASYLSCLAKKGNPKKSPPVYRPLWGSLDQLQASGAAQLALARRTHRAPLRNSNSARLNLRLLATDRGGAQGKGAVCIERIINSNGLHPSSPLPSRLAVVIYQVIFLLLLIQIVLHGFSFQTVSHATI